MNELGIILRTYLLACYYSNKKITKSMINKLCNVIKREVDKTPETLHLIRIHDHNLILSLNNDPFNNERDELNNFFIKYILQKNIQSIDSKNNSEFLKDFKNEILKSGYSFSAYLFYYVLSKNESKQKYLFSLKKSNKTYPDYLKITKLMTESLKIGGHISNNELSVFCEKYIKDTKTVINKFNVLLREDIESLTKLKGSGIIEELTVKNILTKQ